MWVSIEVQSSDGKFHCHILAGHASGRHRHVVQHSRVGHHRATPTPGMHAEAAGRARRSGGQGASGSRG